MQPHLSEAEYLHDYVVRLRFSDGSSADVDFLDELYGPVFEPLKDPDFFKQLAVHPQFHTLYWPNGADFAPEFLRSAVRIAA